MALAKRVAALIAVILKKAEEARRELLPSKKLTSTWKKLSKPNLMMRLANRKMFHSKCK